MGLDQLEHDLSFCTCVHHLRVIDLYVISMLIDSCHFYTIFSFC